ncbi:GGDEF domain-containing protein [Alkalicoccus luteus]|uniref:Diguanylate cyclase n=1 Tax=Alkalicoccus luteus TaxID=1237094 RepID=A0A969PUC6_9BACI|nr:diguanylate cyclase [Alkalicoccus luteus]NJP38088.1 diguanylate cyclase [Alkalicoccus luteus]
MNRLYNDLPCGLLELDMNGSVLGMNMTMDALLGRSDIAGSHVHDLLTRPSRIYFQTFFAPLMMVHGEIAEMHLTFRHRDGSALPMLVNAARQGDRILCALVKMSQREEYEQELMHAKRQSEQILEDKDTAFRELQTLMREYEDKRRELIDLNRKLSRLSITDELTGLPNRRFLEERLKSLLHAANVNHVPFSVMLIDIDHFKLVNDRYGHLVGDDVLRELGRELQAIIREGDTVGRLGGEEFFVLFSSVNAVQAEAAGNDIRLHMESRKWESCPITVSGGIAEWRPSDSADTIMQRADQALYAAKNGGRNQIVVFNDEMNS